VVAAVELWCRVRFVDPLGAELARALLDGREAPDLALVDGVARLALLAVRLGCRIELTEVAPTVRDLLSLAGLPVEMAG
jgi:hypothetical protein